MDKDRKVKFKTPLKEQFNFLVITKTLNISYYKADKNNLTFLIVKTQMF